MISTLSFTSAFIVGLLGSLHCLGMCGGIATALGMQRGNQLLRFVSYHSGRIFTYCLLGALLGFGSHQLQETLPQLGPILRLIAALLLILMGLYVSQWWLGLTAVEKMGGVLWQKIQPIASKALHQKNAFAMISTGMIWGFLPCGLVYSTLGLALTTGSSIKAATIMLGFGLGTLPLLLVSQFAGIGIRNTIFQQLRNKMPRTLAGLILIACGLWTGVAATGHSTHVEHTDPSIQQQHDHNTHPITNKTLKTMD